MKVRGDFVTNSSSVSYILTMKEDIINSHISMFSEDSNIGIFLKRMRDRILNDGNIVNINNEEVYALNITFRDDDIDVDLPDEEKRFLSVLNEKDVKNMTDDQLFDYLFFAIMDGNVPGIGATQTDLY